MEKSHANRRPALPAGIVHRELVMAAAKAVATGNSEDAALPLAALERHFGRPGPLTEERDVYDALSATGLDDEQASALLKAAKRALATIDVRELREARERLAADVRVADDIENDAAGMFIDSVVSEPTVANVLDRVAAERTMNEAVRRKPEPTQPVEPGTHAAAVSLFEKRYADKLSPGQVAIVAGYANRRGKAQAHDFLTRSANSMRERLTAKLSSAVLKEDADLMKRYATALNEMRELDGLDDDSLAEMLTLYQKLVEEIEDEA